jgi:BirA family biotin operon repressor/biotin-[acetyl-CoA-carboxylase] ligase
VSLSPSPAPPAGGEGHWTDLNQDAIVLGLLLEYADDFVSGSVLCDKLDVPRAELLKRIDSLRTRGYGIQASGGRGYRLSEVPDKLDDAVIAPLLSTNEIGRKLHGYPELESTNDEAHRLAEAGAEHGEVVVAEVQTKGRGRRGRSWIAPPGKALTLSVILRPTLPPARAPEITLTAAVAICEAAHEMGAPGARIKWPNDIECRGQKLAGILSELRAEPDRIRHLILGVGLNVTLTAHDFPADVRGTSLLIQSGERTPRPLVCARVLEHLEEWLALHETEGFAPVRERWRELSSTLGRRVSVTGAPPVDGPPLEGEAVDLAEDGALLVRAPEGRLVRVVAADVEHCAVL